MNYKVKVIEGTTPPDLTGRMQDFFANNPGVIIHHMTQSSVVFGKEHYTTVVILYTEA